MWEQVLPETIWCIFLDCLFYLEVICHIIFIVNKYLLNQMQHLPSMLNPGALGTILKRGIGHHLLDLNGVF